MVDIVFLILCVGLGLWGFSRTTGPDLTGAREPTRVTVRGARVVGQAATQERTFCPTPHRPVSAMETV